MIVYTIEIDGELQFVETDPEVVKRVVESQSSIDLAKRFSDKENAYFDYTVKVNSWCI